MDLHAFQDELEKIASAGKVPLSRKLTKQFASRLAGRFRSKVRPQKATTIIAKNKPKHKLGEYTPTMGNAVVSPGTTQQELVAKKPRRKDDVPSREDMDTGPKRLDGRDNATTISGPGSQANNIGATNYPSEHGL